MSDPAWQFYAALQSEADPQSVDRSWARDEALGVILHEVATDRAPDGDLVRKRYYSLCRNRLSKRKHRRALDRGRFRGTHRRGGGEFGNVLLTPAAATALDEVAYAQLTDLILTVLPEEDLGLLLEIADGRSYAEMAHDRNMTVPGIKSKAFRAREKVRASGIAATLRRGLRR